MGAYLTSALFKWEVPAHSTPPDTMDPPTIGGLKELAKKQNLTNLTLIIKDCMIN